jgi:two-component system cell cycle sensor histidine kinase/response regulator CckA
MTASRPAVEHPDAAAASRQAAGVVAIDAEGWVRYLSPAAEAMTGWVLAAAQGRAVEDVVTLVDAARRPRSTAEARRLLMSPEPLRTTHVLLDRGGGARCVELSTAPVRDRDDELVSVVITLCDTEVHDAFALANDRLRMVVQNMPVMLDAFDDRRLITVWNAECERVTGFRAEEVIGNPDALLLMYPDPEYREHMLREWTARGNDYRNWAWEITCKDGTKRTIEWSNVSAELPIPGWTTWGVGVDITERLRLEAKVRESQKMDAIGQLAGGVAHDFNNLLTVMSGCAEEIVTAVEDGDTDVLPLARMIADTVERASLLTRQLLLFSRRGAVRVQTLDLNEVVRRCGHMLARTLGEQVLLRVDLGAGVGAVRGDATQVEQVVFNLCLNARDAMPAGGPLVLSTDVVNVDPQDLAAWPEARAGRFALLTVADAGVGMTREVQGHLFEPFFTTKAVGRGTGLGLATVFGIVQDMAGFIVVDSEPGAGTTVRVFLPGSDAVVGEAPSRARVRGQDGGSETVLLVEDDVSLRRLVARRLTSGGYRVLEAGSGGEAIQRPEVDAGTIDLLLTDLVMPGMSGREAASVLCARCPGLRVLFMSGYSPDAALRDDHGLDGPLIQKPFTMSELLAQVRRVLDGDRPRL